MPLDHDEEVQVALRGIERAGRERTMKIYTDKIFIELTSQ